MLYALPGGCEGEIEHLRVGESNAKGMKKRILVLAGGFSGESVVSLKSAAMVMNHIDRERFEPLLVRIDREGWMAQYETDWLPVNKANLTVELPTGGFVPDLAFIMIHGDPGEDGLLQGYLEMIGVPYTTAGVLNMALTFDKGLTTQTLRAMSLPTTQGKLIRKGEQPDLAALLQKVGLPCFVKPNRGGSSIGMTKVKQAEELQAALDKAFEVDSQVLVEAFLEGRELTCGVIPWKGGLKALPATEIISENEFFDYEAKYHGKSQEITPANIPAETMQELQEVALLIYQALECKGMARVDMILAKGKPHVIEVNTVPGFTEASIIPQQAAAAGIDKKTLISSIIDAFLPA